jgi:hypothetical protein
MPNRIVDVTDRSMFDLIPACADPGFDHRTCDYWENETSGSKAARLAWLEPAAPATASPPAVPDNPFAPAPREPAYNPFAPSAGRGAAAGASRRSFDPFGADDEPEVDNPFAPRPPTRTSVGSDAPRKLHLLGRGANVFGSYAKVLEADGVPAAYAQFGPLSAYPRAQRVRDLYPQLPSAPLPAVITCIATTAAARDQGLARELVLAVVDDLSGRGFSAVEAYPEPGARPDATSAANTRFWLACGFGVAVDDPRFPVVRRDL